MKKFWISAFLLGVVLVTARAEDTAPRTMAAKANWSKKMQELNQLLGAILVDVSSDKNYNAPENQSRIEENAKKLAALTHEIHAKETVSPDEDPSIGIFSGLFATETRRGLRAFENGSKAYAREILRSTPGFCIACHTRNSSGPSFSGLAENSAVDELSPADRGEYFMASRQYDRALSELRLAVGNAKWAKLQPIAWGHAVRDALAVAVRVKQDPNLAEGIVEQVLAIKAVPLPLRQDALDWKESIQKWRNEPPRSVKSEDGFFAEAVRLLTQAQEDQRYPADHSTDITFLRASAAVHDLLQLGSRSRYAAEGYLMAGICYDALRPSFHMDELHEIYYEACIRKSPHTPLSANCYRRYAKAIYEAYTGSRGTDLPIDEEQKLRELEAIAEMGGPSPAVN